MKVFVLAMTAYKALLPKSSISVKNGAVKKQKCDTKKSHIFSFLLMLQKVPAFGAFIRVGMAAKK